MINQSHKSIFPSTQSDFHPLFKDYLDRCFFNHIEIKNNCWIWIGSLNNAGYGLLSFAAKKWAAHRLSYEIFKGPIGTLCVCHKCDTRSCVNPEHLWLGTRSENTRDMFSKGREADRIYQLGDAHRNAKLTDRQVLLLYRLYHRKKIKQSRLVKRFRVTKSYVSNLVRGKSVRIHRILNSKI